MTPKKIVTMRDLAAKKLSADTKGVLNRALKLAYEDQQKILEKAKNIASSKN